MDAFNDEAGKQLTNVYHTQYSDKPGLEKLAKDWEMQTRI